MTPPDQPETPPSSASSGTRSAGQDWIDQVGGSPRTTRDTGDENSSTGAHDAEVDEAEVDEDGGTSEPETAEDRRDQRVRSVVEWIAVIGGAVVVALLVRTFLFTTFWIPSGSMEPTLMGEGRRDRVIVNRLSYKLHDVNRGDIIVFEVPPGEPISEIDGQKVEDLIKRVVGLPGETVSLRDGAVYVDGEKLDEPYLPEGVQTTDLCNTGQTEWVVPDDSLFVMGDNRPMSQDARCWSTHSVKESAVVGRAFIRVWPLNEITLF